MNVFSAIMHTLLDVFFPSDLQRFFTMNFDINPNRLQFLQGCFDAHALGAPDLVSWVNSQWVPAGYIPGISLDDPGIFYFVPSLGRIFGLNLNFSLKLFFSLITFFCTATALWAFWRAFQGWPARVAAFLLVFSALRQVVSIGDTFSIQGYVVLAVLPLLVTFKVRPFQRIWMAPVVLLCVGIILGYAELMRIHSSTGVLLFLFFWFMTLGRIPWGHRFGLMTILAAGFFLPLIQFNILANHRDAFLRIHNPSFVLRPVRHPFWHPIYGALGYMPNPYQPIFGDGAGDQAIRRIDPGVPMYSAKYEEVIRKLTLDIVTQHPGFVLHQALVKLFDMRVKLIRCMVLGLVLIFCLKLPFLEILPFFVCMGFYTANGMAVSPYDYYVIGSYATGWIFSVRMVCEFLERWVEARGKIPNPRQTTAKTT
jgi:hypothetical protein